MPGPCASALTGSAMWSKDWSTTSSTRTSATRRTPLEHVTCGCVRRGDKSRCCLRAPREHVRPGARHGYGLGCCVLLIPGALLRPVRAAGQSPRAHRQRVLHGGHNHLGARAPQHVDQDHRLHLLRAICDRHEHPLGAVALGHGGGRDRSGSGQRACESESRAAGVSSCACGAFSICAILPKGPSACARNMLGRALPSCLHAARACRVGGPTPTQTQVSCSTNCQPRSASLPQRTSSAASCRRGHRKSRPRRAPSSRDGGGPGPEQHLVSCSL